MSLNFLLPVQPMRHCPRCKQSDTDSFRLWTFAVHTPDGTLEFCGARLFEFLRANVPMVQIGEPNPPDDFPHELEIDDRK